MHAAGEGLARARAACDDGCMRRWIWILGWLACGLHAQEPAGRNELGSASSPYLRQHRDNPVHWSPWGPEALARAKRLERPIFLSIGYSACHWCHVMAKESFSDPEVAALLNEEFVCIKVDREERPDLDQIYMGALQAMGRQGGWPLSAWLTPDGKPFFGGTYFPPEDRGGLPGFSRVCRRLAAAWRDEREQVLQGADALAQHLEASLAPALAVGEPTEELLADVVDAAAAWFDAEVPGFAAPPRFAPKFPQSEQLRALLRHVDERARDMAHATLDAMRRGGIHDQLGGGFHRYSTDRRWLVPHFEKMLYDNALLASAYLEAGLAAGEPRLLETGRATLDYILRELLAPEGAFWASQDAQSEGVEGKYFVWTKEQVDEVTGDAAAEVCRVFGVTEAGNWEGVTVLSLVAEAPETKSFAAARAALLAERQRRVPPGTDDKVLVSWNGLAIEALCDGYRALGTQRYLEAAQRAGRFLLARCVQEGRVRRSWQGGAAPLPGYLEDHGALANAMLSLFECDADPSWLRAATDVLEVTRARFGAPDGSFFFTADDHEQLIARTKRATEGATPSGVATTTRAFLRLGLLLGDEARYEVALGALRANHGLLSTAAAAAPSLMAAAQVHLAEPREVVIAGPPEDPRTRALLAVAWRAAPRPGVVGLVHAGNRAALEELSSVFAGKLASGEAPQAYVCVRGRCEAPVSDPDALRAALESPR